MITAELNDDEVIELDSDYPMRDHDRIKELPGARFRLDQWTVPLSWATAVQLRGVFGKELHVGPELTQWSIDEYKERIQPGLALRRAQELDEEDPIIMKWRDSDATPHHLYPYQEAGVKFLVTARKAFLCDDMGTGKTAQSASAMRYLADAGENPFPCLLLVKKSLIRNWVRELEMWIPGVKVAVVQGSAAKRRQILESDADVYIMTYQSVRYHSRLAPYGSVRLRRCHVCDKTLKDTKEWAQTKCEHCPKELNKIPWRTIIADEAHAIVDPKAKQTRAIWSIRTPATANIWLLTGTPITSSPHNMWSSLHLLDPVAFSNRSKFIDRYVLAQANFFGGVQFLGLNPERKEEFFKIIDPFFRRMPKEVVLPYLPRKTYVTREIEMVKEQDKAYQEMKKGLLAQLKNGVLMADNPLVQTTRLIQLASACLDYQPDGTVRMVPPSNKIDEMFEVLDELGDEPLVVFAESRQLIDLAADALEKAKISFSKVVGGLTADQTDKAVQDFQNRKVRVILGTTGAGGVGLNLTTAGTLLFIQRPWKMVESKQTEDRVHRIGSEKHDKITIIDLLSVGTVEDKKRKRLEEKGTNLEELVRDKSFIYWLLDEEEK